MRITAGQLRGRSVHCPPGLDVRPTSAKVRQAFFNILGTRIVGAAFLDVFAGTGLMGFEAVSRGAHEVIFIEESPKHGRAIEQTIETFGTDDEAELMLGDFRRVLPALEGRRFDLIYADPPYKKRYGPSMLALVEKLDLLSPDGIFAVEHLRDDTQLEVSPDGNLERSDERTYGQTAITFYKMKAPPKQVEEEAV